MPSNLNQALAQVRELQRAGDLRSAAMILGGVVRQHPENADLLFQLGALLVGVGDLTQARERLSRVLQLRPRHAHALYSLSVVHQRLGEYDAAHELIDRALGIEPDAEFLVAGKATLHNDQAEFQRAYELLKPRVDHAGPIACLAFARACASLDRSNEGIEILRPLSDDAALARGARMEVLYTLADLYDRSARYDDAFNTVRHANDLQPARFDPEAHRLAVGRTMASWTRERIEAMPIGSDSDRHVFIVGMPRSGTSLIEQILSCHPDVHAVGESVAINRITRRMDPELVPGRPVEADVMSPALVEWAVGEYAQLVGADRTAALRMTDKNPLNFLHMGLISRLFPNARFIHCRRHPMDVCLSCYFRSFPTIDFTDRLEDLGLFYTEYLRLMDHWTAVLDCTVTQLDYEDVVADQEGASRRIVDFLGIPWHDDCLRFHESKRIALTASVNQVSKPIYSSSVQRFRHYERHLQPLATMLEAHGYARD